MAVIGVAGLIFLLAVIPGDSTAWSENDSDKWFGALFFALSVLGAAGFVMQDRNRGLGTALAIVGGLALGTVLFWAILPLLIGLGAIYVAVARARALPAAA
jgi:hypothetical protein